MKIEDIAHVVFRAPDLDRMAGFLDDFGMPGSAASGRLFARGYGASPYLHITEEGEPGFAALGFRAVSTADVEALARSEGAALLNADRPGGGILLRLDDPDGFTIEIVAGQQLPPPLERPTCEGWNDAQQRGRLRRTKRLGAAAAHVIRLGHCVLGVTDFRRSEAWYKERFGFLTSDEIVDPNGKAIGAFLRCDRGDVPTDHHTLALVEAPEAVFHHAAFEVADIDDLLAGHRRLAAGGWQPHWGVGRHVIGSQVFDYWRDPWGHMVEHWTDGDLLVRADGSRIAGVDELHQTQWGPAEPVSEA